jgi:Methylamine utilisation protein MauE
MIAVHWLLAAIFAEALHHKLNSMPRFAAAFAAYRLLPEAVSASGARLIVLLESLTVLLNLFTVPLGLWLAAILLATYAGAMAVNRFRGRSFIDCGCGDAPVPLSNGLIVRNGVLVALCIVTLMVPPQAVSGWADLLEQFAAAAAAYGLYLCVNQLIVNAAQFRLAGYGGH